jgi:hypothetical protein
MVVGGLNPEVLRNMPKCVPGYTLEPEREDFARSQNFQTLRGVRVETGDEARMHKPKMARIPRADAEMSKTAAFAARPTSNAQLHPAFHVKDFDELPAWDALERHVLRFYGYFKEAVTECNLENFRVRRVIIYYYLEDDTMHVGEPRIDNSGIPAGNLIRRHRIPRESGDGHIKAEDLLVGMELTVYGRTMKIVDCDAFTRAYSEQHGYSQGGALPVPTDNFMVALHQAQSVEAAKPRSYEKIYREKMIKPNGGGHINANMQQFMENDRKVCRFYAVMDDTLTAQYERRPCTIFAYLADDTLEIREQYPLNCGRDNFPRYFKRGRLEKDLADANKVRGPMDPELPGEHWKVEDLYIGLQATFLGSPFLIYDCDPFTREYYARHLGVELAPRLDVKLPEREVPRPNTPPYNGYGSWDDSMASVLNLVPKVPRRDFHKLMYNDKKKLGFTAKFENCRLEDENRRFVLTYSLWDDQLAIHEPPQRNSGIVGGRFLEKAVHMNQKTGRLFTPEDLLPGNLIQVMNYEFRMLDMDEGTRKLMEANQDGRQLPAGKEALVPVLEKVRDAMRQQFPLVRDVFRRFDKDHNGVITLEEMKEALQKFSFNLSEEDVAVVLRHFDTRKDGQVSYNEFCDAVLDMDYPSGSPPGDLALKVDLSDGYVDRARAKTAMRSETEKVRRAAYEMSAIVYQNPGMAMKLIKEFASMTHQKEVTVEMVHAALLRLGQALDLEDVERACSFFLGPGANLGAIPYFQLIQQINSSYHDLACNP